MRDETDELIGRIVEELRVLPAVPVDATARVLARVDAGARVAGLGGSLVGVEPQDAQRVRVQLSGADFDVLASWLEGAAADGIRVEELSLQRASGPGRVDARVSLREDAP